MLMNISESDKENYEQHLYVYHALHMPSVTFTQTIEKCLNRKLKIEVL